MEQQIRFCRSADGTRIAYATYGDDRGIPIVSIYGWGHIMEAYWDYPWGREFSEVQAKHRPLVEYDLRGTGASQRDVSDLSLSAHVSDLAAVVDALELSRFDLIGWGDNAAVAACYAAEHPDRVSRLVLCSPFSTATAGTTRGGGAARIVRLIRTDWSLARRTLAGLSFPTQDIQRWWAGVLRNSVSQEVAARYWEECIVDLDITTQLSQLRTPALVLAWHGDERTVVEDARTVAALIPDARFVPLERVDSFITRFVDLVLPFLNEGKEEAPPDLPSGTAIILFADIADSTALTERLGDDAFRSQARALDTALRAVIRENGGTPIEGKLLGDGVLAVFTSARHAIEAALACGRSGDEASLPLHLGLHAGDVIREEDPDGRGNVYGGAVNIAARVSALSAPGEVLVSQTVRDLARTSAGVSFEERGERELKGVSEPVRVWAVAMREEA